MNRHAALAALPLLILPLAACGGGGSKAVGSSSPATFDRKSAGEDAYNDWVSQNIPDSIIGKGGKADRLKAGRALCDDLSSGGDWTSAVKTATQEANLKASDAGGYIAATVDALCPDNLYKLPK